MLEKPKVSVIVPVYKAEAYLYRCVDSLLVQTFTNFEILLIDDGSPDRSGEICDEYARKDTRVRVFHKENGGVSSARNLGLKYAQGEWIAFVDSDDWVESDFLEVFRILSVDVDMIHCGLQLEQNRKSLFVTPYFVIDSKSSPVNCLIRYISLRVVSLIFISEV